MPDLDFKSSTFSVDACGNQCKSSLVFLGYIFFWDRFYPQYENRVAFSTLPVLEEILCTQKGEQIRAMGWMMAALMLIGFFSSCSSSKPSMPPADQAASQWDATVEKHIHYAERADGVKQLGRQLDALQGSLAADIAALKEQFISLNANYPATENEMSRLVQTVSSQENFNASASR